MARPKKKCPLTVSRPALLAGGSDAEFRSLIHDLIAYGHRLDACRDAFASIAGISGVQYEILMRVSRTPGLPVGEVAARLHRSGAFITIEADVERMAKAPGRVAAEGLAALAIAAGRPADRRLWPAYHRRVLGA